MVVDQLLDPRHIPPGPVMAPSGYTENSGKRVTGVITERQWIQARPLIENDYIREDKETECVRATIKEKFGFHPTTHQFHRQVNLKWGLYKNNMGGHNGSAHTGQNTQPRRGRRRARSTRVRPPTNIESKEKQDREALMSDGNFHSELSPLSEHSTISESTTVSASSLISKSSTVLTQPDNYQQGQSGLSTREIEGEEKRQDNRELIKAIPGRHGVDCTSVLDSPHLTRLLENIRLAGDANDDEIPLLDLSNDAKQTQSSTQDTQSFVSLAEIRKDVSQIEASCLEHMMPRPPRSILVYIRSRSNIYVKSITGGERVWPSDFTYTLVDMHHDLSPIVKASSTGHIPMMSSRKLDQPIELNRTKVKKLLALTNRRNPAYHLALKELADRYNQACDYNKAEDVYKELVDIYEDLSGGEDTLYSLHARLDWIYCLTHLNKWKFAERETLFVLAKVKSKHGQQIQLVIRTLNLVSLIASYISTIDTSEELKRQALFVTLSTYGWTDVSTVRHFGELGDIFFQNNDLNRAEEMYTTALHFAQQLRLKEPTILAALSRVYAKRKSFTEAIAFAKLALEQSDAVGESTSLEVGRDYAIILRRQGSYGNSISVFQELLPRYQEYWGENHEQTLGMLRQFAHTLHDAGDFTQAVMYYDTSYVGYERAMGIGHATALSVCKDLGECYIALKEYSKALELFQNTLHKINLVDDYLSEKAQWRLERIKHIVKWLQGPVVTI